MAIGILILSVPVAYAVWSILLALAAKIKGRYLNRYFVVSHKGGGEYELHFRPAFGFYYATPGKYFYLLEDAVQRFKEGYPDTNLFTITSTFHYYFTLRGITGKPVGMTLSQHFFSFVASYSFIVRNLANYRVNEDYTLQLIHLLKKAHRTPPLLFDFSENEGSQTKEES